MAAAALSRSRGVAGVRTTKGLFFIFSLLCLVCLASSLVDKDQLGKLKKRLQKAEQKLDFEKAQMVMTSELMGFYVRFMDPLTALAKEASKELPDYFPPLEGLVRNLKGFVEKAKTYVDGLTEDFSQEIEDDVEKLREMRRLIKTLEEQQAEL